MFHCTYTKSGNKFQNTYVGRITMDSGACLSVVHESLLRQCDFEFTGTRSKEYSGAGGSRLPLLDQVADMKVHVDKIGWIVLRNVLVLQQESRLQTTLLVGRFDLQRLQVSLDFCNGYVLMGKDQKKIKMARRMSTSIARVKRSSKAKEKATLVGTDAVTILAQLQHPSEAIKSSWYDDPEYNNNDSILAKAINNEFADVDKAELVGMISEEDPELIQQSHEVPTDGWSTRANLGDPCHYIDPCCSGCDQCIDEKLSKWTKKNGTAPSLDDLHSNDEIVHSLRSYIERERQRSRSTFTHKQCTIDKGFRAKHPETATKVEKLLEQYKQVFAGDIGEVPDCYTVDVDIVGELSPQRPGHQKFQGTTLIAILKQFCKQIAHGILVDVFEAGVVPKSYLNTLPIKKKDDDGKILEATSALRVVVDSTPINAHTDFRSGRSDNMNDAVNFAAATSVKGFNFKADIGDAYYTIKMKKRMWAYFCVVVPFLGTFCYTRLVQGWMPSASFCVEILGRIFFELHKVMRRYMDDVILASMKDGNTFLANVERFLQICLKNGLRLKGTKTFIGATSYSFLGKRIVSGQVTASPHYVLTLLKVKWEDIKTRTQMRSYVMSFAFLATFLHRSSELLKPLRDVMIGDGKVRVEWTEKLKLAFARSQKALSELAHLYAFNPKYQTVVVVDSSKVATGGFLYQVGPNGPRLIGFFSRTRRDKERKVTLSSCHIELMGLKALIVAYVPLLRQAALPVIVLTDNAPLAAIWTKFKKYELPSTDTRINNALFVLNQCADLRIKHTKHTNQKLRFADMLSRLNITRTADTCEGSPKCTICKAADVEDDDSAHIIAVVSDLVKREGNHGNILDSSESGLMGVPSDSWMFKPTPVALPVTVGMVIPSKMTLRELLNESTLLWQMQSVDKRFRQLKKDIRQGVTSYPKKRTPMQTLLEKRKARIVDGVIHLEKVNQGAARSVIPIPDQYATEVVMVVHRAVGHGTITQTVKQVQRHFEISKPREVVENALKHCIKCALHKGSGAYSKAQMKAVPVPSDMFKTIMVDEITRSVRGKSLKALIAMEAVSGFITVITYTKAMKGPAFVAAMGHIKAILCPHNMDNAVIQLRCDSASWHTSTMVVQGLQLMKIELLLHNSTTLSKNIIPELDARIRLYSKYLIQEIAETPPTMGAEVVCHLAAAKCNNTIGGTGYTPAELFLGRGWKDNETIQLNVKAILEGVSARRATRRAYEDKKNLRKLQKKEQSLVPYDDKGLNSSLVRLPSLTELKAGDTVTLIQPTDKNEPKAAWVVQAVDFKKRQAKLIRDSGLDKQRSSAKWICFSRIEQIFPAETAILHLAAETGATPNPYVDSWGIYRDPDRLKRFMRAATMAIGQFTASSTTPEDALFSEPSPVEPPLRMEPANAASTLLVSTESSTTDHYASAHGSSSDSWCDVSTPPEVFMSSTRRLLPRRYSGSDVTTGDTVSTNDVIQRPSISVSRYRSDFLGSFEDISTETLSDAMKASDMHRLQSIPSGTFRKHSKFPTPAKMEKKEMKMEPTATPIKGRWEQHRDPDVAKGVAKSTPKVERKEGVKIEPTGASSATGAGDVGETQTEEEPRRSSRRGTVETKPGAFLKYLEPDTL